MKILTYLLVSVCLLVSASAQTEDDVTTDGVLSFIEDSAALDGAEGIYRATPFVEVIYEPGFEECVKVGFDQDECPEFEWSLPFIPATTATDAEKVLADEWFRFELRAKHRIGLEIGAGVPLLSCLVGAIDIYWLIFKGDIFFPTDEFCDDKPLQIIPNCLLECDVPLAFCPQANPACPVCIERGFATGMEHAMSAYYPEYLEAVYTKAVVPIAALGGLTWSSTPLVTDGALLAPVQSVENVPDLLQDVANRLIKGGVQDDPRAATYYTQTAAMDVACRAALLVGTRTGLLRLPTESFDPLQPGLLKLELRKRLLSDRESAGSTWKRTLTLLTGWDAEALHPKYTRSSSWAANFFFGEPSHLGAGTPTQAACLGQVAFFELYQKPADLVVATYHPITRRALCWVGPFIGATLAPVPPKIMIFAGPRWHSDWVSVPEGYHIPRTEGEPDVSLRAD